MKKIIENFQIVSPFVGFVIGYRFLENLIESIRGILEKNLAHQQIEAFDKLYSFNYFFGFFSAILLWTFITCIIHFIERKDRLVIQNKD